MGLSLGSWFCSVDLCFCSSANTMLFHKLGYLLLHLRFVLAICALSPFCVNFRISLTSLMRNLIEILIEIAETLSIHLKIKVFMIVSLPFHERDCCSVAQSCPTLCNSMDCSTLGFPVLHYLLELAQIHVHWVDDAIQPSVAPFSSCPQSFPASGSFPVSLLIRWPKHWSCSFTISSPNEYPGLISFRIDWLVLLAVQGTLKHLLQHHSSKASILWCSIFYMVQISHSYMTTGKTIALTRLIFVSEVMSLLFNMLPRFVIAFLPRSKHLLISWLQSPATVILDSKKIKAVTVSIFSLIYLPWRDGTGCDAITLVFSMLSLNQLFHSPLSPSSRDSKEFLFTFCHLGGVICISKFTDISPSNLDYSLCFSSLAFCMM